MIREKIWTIRVEILKQLIEVDLLVAENEYETTKETTGSAKMDDVIIELKSFLEFRPCVGDKGRY
jgi:hypothetical protein